MFRGKVVQNVNKHTISVMVETRSVHPKYRKSFRTLKKYHADIEDEKSVCIGDVVEIVSSRPISKTKKFKFLRKISGEEIYDI